MDNNKIIVSTINVKFDNDEKIQDMCIGQSRSVNSKSQSYSNIALLVSKLDMNGNKPSLSVTNSKTSNNKHSNNDVIDYTIDHILMNHSFVTISEIQNLQTYFIEKVLPIVHITKAQFEGIQEKFQKNNRDRFFSHFISGGGGSIFKYNNLIYKICPTVSIANSPASIGEYIIPYTIGKMFSSNDLFKMKHFIVLPLYVRYGNLSKLYKGLYNLYKIYVMLYIANPKNYKVNVEDLMHINSVDIPNDTNIILNSNKLYNITQVVTIALNLHVYLGDGFSSFSRMINHIINASLQNGYVIVFPLAIGSANKLSIQMLKDYFSDESADYNKLLTDLSLQLVFQVLLFYYVILKYRPNFAHRDLKLDNILIRSLPLLKINFDMDIRDLKYRVDINSSFTFAINDFERSELVSTSKTWTQDLEYFFYSISYYRNLKLPSSLIDIFPASKKWNNSSDGLKISYSDLENVLTGSIFAKFIKRVDI